jgi:hypothetical protein
LLGEWRKHPIVVRTEGALFNNDADVLALLRANSFDAHSPALVRAVLWQYWVHLDPEKATDQSPVETRTTKHIRPEP